MKSYDQYCGLATALDLVGDRWTLLIVRELLYLGPRRFTDLEDGLPGIAPNLLSARLRALQEAGLVERSQLPAPAASSVYRLTPDGLALREAVSQLMLWGTRFLPPLRRSQRLRPDLPVMALQASFRSEDAAGVDASYEFDVDGQQLVLVVHDGGLAVSSDRSGREQAEPALRFTTTLRDFAALATGQLDALEAVTTGRLTVDGDLNELPQFARLFARSP